jgi:hypothetical protein
MNADNQVHLVKVLRELADQVEAMPPDRFYLNLDARYRNLGLDEDGYMRRELLPGYAVARVELNWGL